MTTDNTYTYDALDRQRSDTQAVAGTNTSTTTMNYSGQDTGVATETTDTTPSRRYTLGPGGAHTAMTWTTGTGALTQPHNHYLGTDGKGSITQITGDSTASGTPTGTSGVACATRQDPWGKTSGSTPGNSTSPCPTNAAVSTSTTSNDIYYRGERRDNSTGNYQLGSRTYDPAKTAFLSQDTYRNAAPQGDLALGTDPLTQNRYNYVNGDPINLADPSGHDPINAGSAGNHTCDKRCGDNAYIDAVLDRRATLARYAGVAAYTREYRIRPRSGIGLVRTCAFISQRNPGLHAPGARDAGLQDIGDDRDFNSQFGVGDCRVLIAIDYDTGRVALRQNPSCRDYASYCQTPGAPPDFQVTQSSRVLAGVSVNTVNLHLGFKNPRNPPGFGFAIPKISGDIRLTDVGDRRIHVGGRVDGFPSFEVYQDTLGGRTETHARTREGAVVDLIPGFTPQTSLYDTYDYRYTRNNRRFFVPLPDPYSLGYAFTRAQKAADDEAALGIAADQERDRETY